MKLFKGQVLLCLATITIQCVSTSAQAADGQSKNDNVSTSIIGKSSNTVLRREEVCEDTTAKFEVQEPSGKIKRKGCDWVQEMKTAWRCDRPGVRTQCPETCGGCGCTDGMGRYTVTLGTFVGKKKSCEWAGDKPRPRCNDPAAKEYCPVSCGNCPSPVLTPAPSAITPSPTPSPTTEPTTSKPTQLYDWCVDTSGKFKISSKSWITQKKNCKWAAYKPWFACSIPEVEENCPVTCEKCTCLNNQNRFKVKEGEMRSCSWAAKSDTWWRCNNVNNVRRNCPLLCGECDVEFPSAAPSSSPTIEKFPTIIVETTFSIPADELVIPEDPDELALLKDILKTTFADFLPPNTVIKEVILRSTTTRQASEGVVEFVIDTTFECLDEEGCDPGDVSEKAFEGIEDSLTNGVDGGLSSDLNQAVQAGINARGSNQTAVFGEKSSGLSGNVTNATVIEKSAQPSGVPTDPPTSKPSIFFSDVPSAIPTNSPVSSPSGKPSPTPTGPPTASPTTSPTKRPTLKPSPKPSIEASLSPSEYPSELPSELPSDLPSELPSGQ